MKAVRIDKLLANLGYGSRREIGAIARGGGIVLDGVVLTDASARLPLDPDLPKRLVVDGEPVDPLPGLALMLNKPAGVTCSHREVGPLVYGLLPPRWRRREPPLSTVGRLDKDSSGLLLLTDDGALLHRLIAPKADVGKRYHVTLARPLRGDEAALIGSGAMMLDGEDRPLKPALFQAYDATHAAVTLHEGRYHQVRRMFAAVGNHVTALHRDRIGGLALPEDLAAGAFRILEPSDLATVFVGGSEAIAAAN